MIKTLKRSKHLTNKISFQMHVSHLIITLNLIITKEFLFSLNTLYKHLIFAFEGHFKTFVVFLFPLEQNLHITIKNNIDNNTMFNGVDILHKINQ